MMSRNRAFTYSTPRRFEILAEEPNGLAASAEMATRILCTAVAVRRLRSMLDGSDSLFQQSTGLLERRTPHRLSSQESFAELY